MTCRRKTARRPEITGDAMKAGSRDPAECKHTVWRIYDIIKKVRVCWACGLEEPEP